MKKGKAELLRLETVIGNDRLKLKEEFLRLMENDLMKVLGEYFYLETLPQTEIIKEGRTFRVCVNFTSSGIKNFINIP